MLILEWFGLCMKGVMGPIGAKWCRSGAAKAALSGLVVLTSGLVCGAASLTRDEVWRGLFARPEPGVAVPGLDAAARERARLGATLFRDTRLSGAGTRSCASCHEADKGFSNGSPRGVARDGAPLSRNVPALYDLAWGRSFMWDGRAESLEAQARLPILAPDEMAGDFDEITRRLSADPQAVSQFATAFTDGEISQERIVAALAAFVRTIVSPQTPFDRWVNGDDEALGALEKEGFAIFVGEGGCVACHGGWRFTDDGFHDIGLDTSDAGRASTTQAAAGARIFKTPSLRELKRTAPYMHDGSIRDLDGVVDHYAGGFLTRSSLDAGLRRDLKLDDRQRKALAAFLASLSSVP